MPCIGFLSCLDGFSTILKEQVIAAPRLRAPRDTSGGLPFDAAGVLSRAESLSLAGSYG
jgi:hypothetical protein